MTRLLRVLFLLLTIFGVGMRVSDLHSMAHEISHEVCEHEHHHDEEAPDPCTDPHHHHQCTCLQPFFCLPEFTDVSIAASEGPPSPQPERCDWGMPEDPVYTLEIPPIIG